MIEEIKQLLDSRNELAKQSVILYKPIVQQYINDNCRDSNKIAYTLDFMLDFCFDEQMLQLYRRLCRHLYSFAPEAAVYYVNSYREMWDEEGTRFGKINNSEDLAV